MQAILARECGQRNGPVDWRAFAPLSTGPTARVSRAHKLHLAPKRQPPRANHGDRPKPEEQRGRQGSGE
ncbi:hypothetical protein GCM10010471_11400 [Leucobacter komagatae]